MLTFEARRGPLFMLLALLLLPTLVALGYLVYGERIALIASKASESGLAGQLATLGAMICAMVLALLVFATFSLRSVLTVTLRPTGLAGRGRFGKAVFLPFDAMRAVRRVRLPFAPLARIDSANGHDPLYLPLFLSRPQLLTEAAHKLREEGVLADEHPLLQVVAQLQ